VGREGEGLFKVVLLWLVTTEKSIEKRQSINQSNKQTNKQKNPLQKFNKNLRYNILQSKKKISPSNH
jgi:ribosomal protein S8